MNNKELTILQWNVNGLKTRVESGDISTLIYRHNPAILCFQHTGNFTYNSKKYKIAISTPNINQELGTAIYVRNDILHTGITTNIDTCQFSGIKIYLQNKQLITIGNIYNQPSMNYNITNLLNSIKNINGPSLIVGDFNAHSPTWDNKSETADIKGTTIEKFLMEEDYVCLNNAENSTYYSSAYNTFSSIDLSICSASIAEKFNWKVLDDHYSSDHMPILISCLGNTSSPPTQKYKLRDADWNNYEKSSKVIPQYFHLEDPETVYNTFFNFLDNLNKEKLKLTSNSKRTRQVPWWNKALSEMVKDKKYLANRLARLTKKYKKLQQFPMTPTNIKERARTSILYYKLKPIHNRIKAFLKREIKRCRENYWIKYISSVSSSTPMALVWRQFRIITGTASTEPKHQLIKNNKTIHDNKDIANIMGSNFQEISSLENIDPEIRRKMIDKEKNLNFKTQIKEEYNMEFTINELNETLKTCDSSSPGADNISYIMLKHLSIQAKKFLLYVFNLLWKKAYFPEPWKHAIIIPIQKPGKNPSDPNSYRPISLTSCICKLMEKMVKSRLEHFVEKEEMLSQYQFGSRKNRSTIDALTCMESYIKSKFEDKIPTMAIFFDIKKAYDTAWRYNILKELESKGMKGELPLFIQNFLTDRTFQVSFNNTLSKKFSLQRGIPQGSVLSGILFTIAINKISDGLPRDVKHSLFVDDFALYYSSKRSDNLTRMLQLATNNTINWTKSVGFNIAAEKNPNHSFL